MPISKTELKYRAENPEPVEVPKTGPSPSTRYILRILNIYKKMRGDKKNLYFARDFKAGGDDPHSEINILIRSDLVYQYGVACNLKVYTALRSVTDEKAIEIIRDTLVAHMEDYRPRKTKVYEIIQQPNI